MKLHEKSLELNVTHELLNLADCWYWFLTDIPLWRYWKPRYRLPFLKHNKSSAAGFHIKTEGKNDPTGNAGGGFDVRIKSGVGGHLLFIQYKMGDFCYTSPDKNSIFEKSPHEHYKFKINSTNTNQHFLLQDLAKGIGAVRGNAVVYALPLVKDITEMEQYAGRLIRRTKFISIADLDKKAVDVKKPFQKNQEHNFRVCAKKMDRCEVNYYYYASTAQDQAPSVIADVIAMNFEKTFSYYTSEIISNYKRYNLEPGYIDEGLWRAFGQYIRYLLHYFEVNPSRLSQRLKDSYQYYLKKDDRDIDFADYKSEENDLRIIHGILNALEPFKDYIDNPLIERNGVYSFKDGLPRYRPSIFTTLPPNGINFNISREYSTDDIETIGYLVI